MCKRNQIPISFVFVFKIDLQIHIESSRKYKKGRYSHVWTINQNYKAVNQVEQCNLNRRTKNTKTDRHTNKQKYCRTQVIGLPKTNKLELIDKGEFALPSRTEKKKLKLLTFSLTYLSGCSGLGVKASGSRAHHIPYILLVGLVSVKVTRCGLRKSTCLQSLWATSVNRKMK